MAEHTPNEWLLPQDRLDLVSETNHEISKIAEGIVRLMEVERNDDFLIYHGMLARIQQLSNIQFYALRLHGEAGEAEVRAWGEHDTNVERLVRAYKGMEA